MTDSFHEWAPSGNKRLAQFSSGVGGLSLRQTRLALEAQQELQRSRCQLTSLTRDAGRLDRRDKGRLNINKQSDNLPNQTTCACQSKHEARGHQARAEEVSK